MNDFKWFMIFLISIVVFGGGGIALSEYFNQNNDVEFAKAGLEQCPVRDGYANTYVWVKDCVTYTKEVGGR